MTDKEMVVHRLTETSNFIDYLKTSPLFSKSLIDVMVTAIDNGVAMLTEQPEIVHCKDCKWYDNDRSLCDNTVGMPMPREQMFYCADGKRKA